METPPKFIHLFTFSLFLFSLLITLSNGQDLFCNAHDKAILLQVKSHFKSVGLLSQWTDDDDCCDWPFIGCTSQSDPNPGRVNALTVSGGSGLAGNIPAVIGGLPFLGNLLFHSEPKLTGSIPGSFINLTRLRILDLDTNSLSGVIPSFLGNLKSLQQIDLSGNHFSGSIPATLSLLPALSLFNVSHNSLTGSIPNLPAKTLTTFDVSYNQLCGKIPTGLSKFGSSSFQHNKCLCGPPLGACKGN